MKTSFKQFLLPITIILVSLPFVYYFSIYIPQRDVAIQQKQIYELNLKNRAHCKEMGEKYTVQQKKDDSDKEIQYQVIFDEGLDECLYQSEETTSLGIAEPKNITKSIINLYTNRTLATYSYQIEWSHSERFVFDGDEEEYNKLENYYFEKNYPPIDE